MMKKLIINCTVLSMLFLGMTIFSPRVLSAPVCDKGTITSQASEFKYVAPDTATISFAVKTTDKNSQKAVELNNQKVSKIIEVLKKTLNADEAIKTSYYTLTQNYEYNNITKKNVPDGYEVINTLTVKLKDTQKTGKIIDIATKNGATNVNSLSFTLQNTDGVCKELTAKAVLKAKNEAQSVLAPLGKTIDAISSINYSCTANSSYSPYRNFAMAKGLASTAEGSDSAISIEQGETRVDASVTIVFTIK